MSSRIRIAPALATSVAALALASCTTPQPNAELQQARAAYAAAEQDPAVASGAAGDLQTAKAYLDKANSAEAGNAEAAEVTHRAYMANQQVRIAYQRAELQRIEAQARNTPRALAASGDVYFSPGSATIAPGTHGTLDRLVAFLEQNPSQRVRIVGFTDSTGSEATNMRLSQQRADAVRTALVSRGINASRIETQGSGEASPVASNNTAHGRQMNRRAVVMVTNFAITGSGSTTGPEATPPTGGTASH
jgi:outer membrane protein OmpA-like peptidoglycan-associated protein